MELAYAGYFSKAHGVKGQLVLRLENDLIVDEVKTLFVETNTGKAPYFISDVKENKSGLIVTLEELDAVEKARVLIGKKVFVDAQLILAEEENLDWLGFELIDQTRGSLGTILEVSDNGSQLLVTVKVKDREILLPLVEEFIDRIDEEAKKLFFKAPEGLIDLYLDN